VTTEARVALRTLDSLDVRGQRVLTRVDFNVPLQGDVISDDTRIRSALPTIQALLERGASVLLVSHLGRPKGRPRAKYSLKPVAQHLSKLLGQPVALADDVVGPSARELAAQLRPGEVALLENVRFEPGEEANDPGLARKLAALADVYVNDAFGAAHRAHASTEGVAHLLPSGAGLLMQHELEALGKVLDEPAHPVVVIFGGAKISDKIDVIRHFLGKADAILVGGGLANTFLKAQGLQVGASLVEDDSLAVARDLRSNARRRGVKLLLPTDVAVSRAGDADAPVRIAAVDDIQPDEAIFDIGPATRQAFAAEIAPARTIVWNGPMGLFERPPFDEGTRAVAEAVATSDSYSVVGGGDSVAALHESGQADKIDHISTGGGASLELLEGRTLPGVAALEDNA
jgi:phosphoglycerate kinase